MLGLLRGLIDYAGLFPPAQLGMDEALDEYREAAGGRHAWMLERFICPASRLGELPPDLRVTVVVDDPQAPLDHPGIEVVEGRIAPDELAALAPEGTRVFGESDDLDAVAAAGVGAKVRCGGERVPTAGELAAFVTGCAERGLDFKATAGLHHPFRAPGRHGFVNLLAASGLARSADVAEVLDDQDPASFTLDGGELLWRGRPAGSARTHFTGYGSCSFREPVDDLRTMGWIE